MSGRLVVIVDEPAGCVLRQGQLGVPVTHAFAPPIFRFGANRTGNAPACGEPDVTPLQTVAGVGVDQRASVGALPARQWSRDAATLEHLLTKLREWHALPVVLDALYEDLEAVLGEQADPTSPEVEDLAARLRDALMRLVGVALREGGDRPGDEAAKVIERAKLLCWEEPPEELVEARAHVRRLALVALDLLDLLLEDTP
ncbi:DUF6415 family natural product biosynthesis protein [Streptomyces scopuliridis]|uniref:DUF6415 family natural product biosynthesis protein n=1 Tax=Streptomyces scopuliridis TaxID=452529 RepID=UPI00369B1E42